MAFFESITDFQQHRDKIQTRAYGMIEVIEGRLQAIHFRPWPKLISAVEAAWIGGWKHKRAQENRCVLYYNQPIAHRKFLTLAYVESTLGTSFASFRKSLLVLDQIAMTKKSDAILCEASNPRISDRLFQRWGWEPHIVSSKKRHWIKRFYGDYQSVEKQSHLVKEFSR